MKHLFLVPAVFLLASEGAGHAQTIAVSVRDLGNNPVYSNVYFRRSSSSSWDRLGETDSRGDLKATLACAPGTEIYADPIPGEYWNSPEMACQSALPLKVAPRRRQLLSELLPFARENDEKAATRSDLAYVVARAEVSGWRGHGKTVGTDSALQVYLASPGSLRPEQASLIRTNLLNESSGFYAEVDANRDGLLTRKEINAAIAVAGDDPR